MYLEINEKLIEKVKKITGFDYKSKGGLVTYDDIVSMIEDLTCEYEVLQEENCDCAICCLSSIIKYYKGEIPLETLRIEDEKTDHFFYGYLYLAIADVITVRQASEVSGVMFIDKEDVLKQAKNCNYDSVVAFKEILKRAKAKGIM